MVITARGWWTSAGGLISLAYGVAMGITILSMLGLLTIGVVFATWLYMRRMLRSVLRTVEFQAEFLEPGPLRVGRPLQLALHIGRLPHPVSSLFTLEPVAVGYYVSSSLSPMKWVSKGSDSWKCVFCPVPSRIGRAGVLGLGFGLQDPAGWFTYRGFLPGRKDKPVLALLDIFRFSPRSARKETNVLARPGLLLHEKPGQSMEFLGIRDLQPGDSIRRVSWKASLRRDRLLVRETEWEVPAVVQCLVDAGGHNRQELPGSKTRALDDIATLAGQLFRRVLNHGNPAGLTLVSENDLLLESPGLGPAHLLRMELAFANIASQAVQPGPGNASQLAVWADGILGKLFPELMDPSKNRLPLWYSWVEGFPAYPTASPGHTSTLAERLDRGRFWFWVLGPVGWLMLPIVFFLTDPKRRIGLARKRVAATLASLLPLAPGALERLLQDDSFFVNTSMKGLAQFGINSFCPSIPGGMVEPKLQIGQGRRLAKALLGRLALARDHQMFVVILSASKIPFGLSPLLDALKRCVARGHRVLVWDIAGSAGDENQEDLLLRKVSKDLAATLAKSGVGYWPGTSEQIMARWDLLFRKEGLLGSKRKN